MPLIDFVLVCFQSFQSTIVLLERISIDESQHIHHQIDINIGDKPGEIYKKYPHHSFALTRLQQDTFSADYNDQIGTIKTFIMRGLIHPIGAKKQTVLTYVKTTVYT